MQKDDYYVYVYIDPRNHEEFYYGKGRGARKAAHLNDKSDREMANRIAAIRKAGLEPIVRVIARNLTESEALLVEKTLLWKLGKWTLNIATGHFAGKFRPKDTLHQELSGFDFQEGLYFFSVGECDFRNWDDFRLLGFISGGWGAKHRDTMKQFRVGDVVAAHMSRRGFVGIGKIQTQAVMIRDVKVNGTPLLDFVTCSGANHDRNNADMSEYVCLVKWIRAVPRSEAKWQKHSKLFAKPVIRASLDGQPATVAFLEQEFNIDLASCRK